MAKIFRHSRLQTTSTRTHSSAGNPSRRYLSISAQALDSPPTCSCTRKHTQQIHVQYILDTDAVHTRRGHYGRALVSASSSSRSRAIIVRGRLAVSRVQVQHRPNNCTFSFPLFHSRVYESQVLQFLSCVCAAFNCVTACFTNTRIVNDGEGFY